MKRRAFLAAVAAGLLKSEEIENFGHYVEDFNHTFKEEVVNAIPDAAVWDWMKANVPVFACPDREIEQLYYYRWWAFRKHIKPTAGAADSDAVTAGGWTIGDSRDAFPS